MPPVESEADLESFFNEDEFAIVVETEIGKFTANFNNEYAAAFFDTNRIGSQAPELECQTSDVIEHQVDKDGARVTIEIKGCKKEYVVREHQPDGTGVSRLILSRL